MRVRTIALVVALCAISGALVVACDDKEDSKQTVGNAASPTSRAITSPLAGYEAEAACYGSPGTDEEEDDDDLDLGDDDDFDVPSFLK